jgi:hypothetical protein
MLPEARPEDIGGVVKVYDLCDPEAWGRAGRERAAWGRERSEIHRLDNDHVIIEFKPGGALEASA